MKIKTSELTGAALDWAVSQSHCEELVVEIIPQDDKYPAGLFYAPARDSWYEPSTNWSQGGPIIEREGVNLSAHYKIYTGEWQAWCEHGPSAYGPTPLIAAMRCYVASKLGDEVDVPEELA